MTTARAIQTLQRRRDFLVDRVVQRVRTKQAESFDRAEITAIDKAIEALQNDSQGIRPNRQAPAAERVADFQRRFLASHPRPEWRTCRVRAANELSAWRET
jgi:hypothetical protein